MISGIGPGFNQFLGFLKIILGTNRFFKLYYLSIRITSLLKSEDQVASRL